MFKLDRVWLRFWWTNLPGQPPCRTKGRTRWSLCSIAAIRGCLHTSFLGRARRTQNGERYWWKVVRRMWPSRITHCRQLGRCPTRWQLHRSSWGVVNTAIGPIWWTFQCLVLDLPNDLRATCPRKPRSWSQAKIRLGQWHLRSWWSCLIGTLSFRSQTH